MIELHTYVLFIGAVVLLVMAPGPDMAYMLGRTIAQGRKAGIVAAIGINAGAYVHVFAAVLGLSAILAASSFAFAAVKIIGACYLIWIGLRAISATTGPADLEQNQSRKLDYTAIFWQGFLSDVLNPKVAVFYLAFLPQFVDVGSANKTSQLLILGVTSNMIAVCINIALVCFASVATAKLRRNRKLSAWLNKAMGALFVALGLRLASEKL